MAKINQTTIVYTKIKERIDNGFYSPGESLPEMELSIELSASRNTIKKALLMLENDAYVTIETNKGAKVRSVSKQEVLDYLQLRVELEGFIMRLAVPLFTDADIQKLDDIFSKMKKLLDDNDLMGYSAMNQQFHSIIYDTCPNKTATEMLTRLKSQMRKYNAKTILVPGRNEHSYEEHKAILDAIKKREVHAAETSIRQHVENVRDTFEKYYSLLF
ncbi:MAG: GntR family transcriptional regulator [Lachnospiraceae bacterium]|nr:GntR family transcriptional regulator [Lachnospiraceae bacterium]